MTEKITESLKLISSAKTRRDKNKETIITRMIMKMTNELLQLLRIPRKKHSDNNNNIINSKDNNNDGYVNIATMGCCC